MAEFKKVGPALAALRKAAGLRQQDLAERLGVGASTIGRFESVRANPRASSIDRYLKALGRTPLDLLKALERTSGLTSAADPAEGRLGTPAELESDPRALAKSLEDLREEFYSFRDDVTFRLSREAGKKTRPTNGPKQKKRPSSSSE